MNTYISIPRRHISAQRNSVFSWKTFPSRDGVPERYGNSRGNSRRETMRHENGPERWLADSFYVKQLMFVINSNWRSVFTQNRHRFSGISYFLKHCLCALYVTFKTKTAALKFPIPEPVINLNPVSAGFFHSEHEWKQERPKAKEHLRVGALSTLHS